MIQLTPAHVANVIREEAFRARASFDDVLGRSQKLNAIHARASAIKRLLGETG